MIRPLLVLLAILATIAVLPNVVDLGADHIDLDAILQPPSPTHPLGTDENGRDALARLVVGARTTILIGGGGAALAVLIGVLIGGVAGATGGIADAVLMRIVDVALAFPGIFAILLVTAIVGSGPITLILLIGLTGWMPIARLVRGDVRGLLHQAYVEAARAVGASPARILSRHLVPNAAAALFVAAVLQFGRAIVAEATISFLGLGIQPPTATWGNLLIGAQDYLYTAPWLALAPGLSITLTLLAVYGLGIGRAVGPASAR